MNKIYIVLPCFNEEACIARVIEDWNAQAEKLNELHGLGVHMVIVDDGSRDGTCEVVRNYQRNDHHIVLLERIENGGLGAAVDTGFQYVLSVCDPRDTICIMDSDNTHGAGYVFKMLDQMKHRQCDVVIASRYQPGSAVYGLSKFRERLSECAGWYFSVMMKVPGVRDFTCGYRLYRGEMVRRLYDAYAQNPVTQTGFTCMVEILYKIHRLGGRFAEVPFTLRYDLKEGQSKMKIVRTAARSLLLPIRLLADTYGLFRKASAGQCNARTIA